MKKLIFILLFYSPFIGFSQIVNIPDINFKNALLNHNPIIDTNGDGEIQIAEAESFTADMNLYNKNISDMTGIESFINLLVLECGSNNLVSLDLSENKYLAYLDCRNGILTSLNLPNRLGFLWCLGNNLTSIDVSNNTDLWELNCSSNALTELNVFGCSNLRQITCEGNFDLTYIDLSNTPKLYVINAVQCSLSSIDVSNQPVLIELYLGSNQLTNIDLSNNPYLHRLGLSYNNLTELDISNNPYLKLLWCHHNQISSLDLSIHSILENFSCGNNQLEYLDLRNGNNENCSYDGNHNPNLTCIFVDDAEYSTENWTDYADPNSTFVETEAECDAITVISELNLNTVDAYPNPFIDTLYIQTGFTDNLTISIYNTLGKKVLSTTNKRIDTQYFEKGVYMLKITSKNGKNLTKKVIKID